MKLKSLNQNCLNSRLIIEKGPNPKCKQTLATLSYTMKIGRKIIFVVEIFKI